MKFEENGHIFEVVDLARGQYVICNICFKLGHYIIFEYKDVGIILGADESCAEILMNNLK